MVRRLLPIATSDPPPPCLLLSPASQLLDGSLSRCLRTTADHDNIRLPKQDSTPSPRRRKITCASSASAPRAPTTPRPSSVCMFSLSLWSCPQGSVTNGKLRSANGCRPSARTDLIDKNTKEIKQDDDKVVYKTLEEIGDDLPDHSPRFILLSYPLTLVRFRSRLSPTLFIYRVNERRPDLAGPGTRRNVGTVGEDDGFWLTPMCNSPPADYRSPTWCSTTCPRHVTPRCACCTRAPRSWCATRVR